MGRDGSAPSGYRMAPTVCPGHSRGHVLPHREVCLQALHNTLPESLLSLTQKVTAVSQTRNPTLQHNAVVLV